MFLVDFFVTVIFQKSLFSKNHDFQMYGISYIFLNNVKSVVHVCNTRNCSVCSGNLRPDSDVIISTTNGRSYRIDSNLNCNNSGIYCISSSCLALYTGKPTGYYNKRFDEHFTSKSSAVLDHLKTCQVCKRKKDFSIQYLENMFSRGKYSLSEREYLWNERLRGILNIQKTLKG